MSIHLPNKSRVLPGEVLYTRRASCVQNRHEIDCSSSTETKETGLARAGAGCYAHITVDDDQPHEGSVIYHILASRIGVVRWSSDNTIVAVEAQGSRVGAVEVVPNETATTRMNVFGPRVGDRVHVRIVRVSRLFAMGEIISINGVWSSSSSASSSSLAFRGVLRVEDIRPFRPNTGSTPSTTNTTPITAPTPSQCFCCGDVVLAEVISQSDARQYQLSTLSTPCGVVQAYASPAHFGSCHHRVRKQAARTTAPGEGASAASTEALLATAPCRLVCIPHRRDVMLNPCDGSTVPRWAPLTTE